MPQRIQLPDGTLGEFPDGMSDSEIESVLRRQFAPTPEPESGGGFGIGDLVKGFGNFQLGGFKEAARRAVSLGDMLRRGMAAIPYGPGAAMQGEGSMNAADVLGDWVNPTNPAQQAGAKVENMAEYFAPGMGAGGALAQGAKAGLLSMTQGASPQAAATSGALAGAGPLLGKALVPVSRGLRSMAKTQYGKALGATTQGLKAESQAVVPQLLEKRVSGSLKGLMEKAKIERTLAGSELSATYKAAAKAGKLSDTDAVAQSIEALKEPFYATTASGSRIPANPPAIAKLDEVKALIEQFGPKAPPDQLWKVRKNLDDIIQSSNGFGRELARGTAVDIKKQARAAIQKELSKASPDIEGLNATYSLWKGLERVTSATLKRQEGQSKVVEAGFNALAGGGLGALLGGGTGSAVGATLAALIKTPTWRTVSAVQKARIADLLASGQGRALAAYLTRLGAATATHPPRD